jgi:hypothetical protein
MDAVALAKKHGHDDIVTFYTRLLFGIDPTEDWQQRIAAGVMADNEGDRARKTVGLILATPEAQIA